MKKLLFITILLMSTIWSNAQNDTLPCYLIVSNDTYYVIQDGEGYHTARGLVFIDGYIVKKTGWRNSFFNYTPDGRIPNNSQEKYISETIYLDKYKIQIKDVIILQSLPR